MTWIARSAAPFGFSHMTMCPVSGNRRGQSVPVTLDLLSALDVATDQFREHLAVVGDDEWTVATPCTDWNVHYLVAHVVGGNRFASLVLAGRTAKEAMEAVMGSPQLGTDPLGAFVETSAEQRKQFNQPGALDRRVDHPLGELTAERFLTMRVFDIAMHSWDLAMAIGRSGELDPALAEYVLGIVLTEAPGMGFGIEPCGKVGPEATAMERLLDLCGRCV
jgi:uncharacterized protein (TIGR03086 family)